MAWRYRRQGLDDDASLRVVDQALPDDTHAHAHADQTASYADTSASERDAQAAWSDDAGGREDQRASDADQAVADREFEVQGATVGRREHHDAASAVRSDTTAQREDAQQTRAAAGLARIRAEAQRYETSTLRDEVARERDRAADIREGAARRADAALLAAHPTNAVLRQVVALNTELRDHALADRRRAAVDRQRAAEDRLNAAAAQRQARIDVQRAQLDGMTGSYARQLGHAALRSEIERCRRAGDPFVLAYVSIDGLPTVNERDGRTAGDALIQTVVTALAETLRSYDPVVRIRGKEFLCGLPGTEPAAALLRAEEIRTAVRYGQPPGMISVGFAVAVVGDALEALVESAHADMLLDRSRHDGGSHA